MSKKLTSQRVFWYSIIAGLGFILVFAMIYPFVNTAVVPWWNKLLGIEVVEEGEAPPGYVYHGQLKINKYTYWVYDQSSQTSNLPTVKVWHANKDTLFGTITTNNVTGEVLTADQGILYMTIDWGTGTTYYLDAAETLGSTDYLTEMTPWDYDNDGTVEYCYKLDVSGLAPLTAGETQREITINNYVWQSQATPTITSSINVTGISTTAYGDYYCEGYMSGWTSEGYMFKIVKAELNIPSGTNCTYVENGTVKLKQIKVETNAWSSYSWELANTRFYMNIGVTDTNNEYYGIPIIYRRGAGSSFASYKVWINAKFSAGGDQWLPTLKLTYINPAGTLGTVQQVMNFSR